MQRNTDLYEVVKSIPKGRVATYGQVALLAGNLRWARVAPVFAFGGEGVQRQLLESEGIVLNQTAG